ncbi:MAG: Panacea domain-containing protein [Thermodesulfobacteriota bacterium]|nr:Panacea domain-containing protein [Thermodesulfobacteriota bacterium]
MIITHSREKLINAVLFFAEKTNFCGKTKLMKLLYFLDFMHFKQTGKAVTDLDYFAWEQGPVPKVFFEEISKTPRKDLTSIVTIQNCGKFQKILPIKGKKPDLDFFSPRELMLLEEISYTFKDVQANDITDISHLPNEPWSKTKETKGMLQLIDYNLAIDTKAAKNLPPHIAKQRHIERREMLANFGVK